MCIQRFHLCLIGSAKGSYHSQLSLTYPIHNQNYQGCNFNAHSSSAHFGDEVNPSFFPTELRRLVSRKASPTQCENRWHADREAHGWTSTYSLNKTAVMKNPPWAPHNNKKSLPGTEMMIVTSCKKSRRHQVCFDQVHSVNIPGGVTPWLHSCILRLAFDF